MRGKARAGPDWSHIYLDVLSALPLGTAGDESIVATSLRSVAGDITMRASAALRRAAVAQWEIKLRVSSSAGAWRVVVSVPTGHESGEDCVDVYREVVSNEVDGRNHDINCCLVYRSVGDKRTLHAGSLHGMPVTQPYSPLALLQQKRLSARRHKTTYCYDFPAVFENALREIWAARAAAGEPGAVPPAGRLVDAEELVPAPNAELSFKRHTPLIAVE